MPAAIKKADRTAWIVVHSGGRKRPAAEMQARPIIVPTIMYKTGECGFIVGTIIANGEEKSSGATTAGCHATITLIFD
jgi:hypothetical protein